MRIRGLILLFGTLAIAACNDNDVNGVPIVAFGTFTLQSVNGQSLPATLVDSVSPPLTIAVVSGSITLNTDGTFNDIANLQQSLGGLISQSTVTCAGTFGFSGNTLTFNEAALPSGCGGTFTGTLNNGTLTASIRGAPAVFVR